MLDSDEKKQLDDEARFAPHAKKAAERARFDQLIREGFTADEIANMENSAVDGAIDDKLGTAQDEAEKTKLGNQLPEQNDLFRDEDEPRQGGVRGLIRRRKAVAIGGGAGIVITGGMVLFGVFSGPLQFIQVAQLLQQFHFSAQEDIADDRMAKIARFIRYRESPQNMRLGALGNKYANHIEARFNQAGIESGYTDTRGYFNGYVIDPERIPSDSAIADIRNDSLDEASVKISERFGIDPSLISIDEGAIRIDASDLGYFKAKGLIKTALVEAGYSKIVAAVQARVMVKRAGISLNPIRRMDKRIFDTYDKVRTKVREDRHTRIKNGEVDTPNRYTAEDTTDTDGDGNPDSPDANAGAVAGDAEDVTSPTTGPGTLDVDAPDAKVQSVKSKVLAKAGSATAIVGIICAVQTISENIDDIKYANVVLPLMRMGGEAVAVGNEVMVGNDIDLEQLGVYNELLNDPEVGGWMNAKSIQAELGQEQVGPDILPEAEIQNEANAVSQFLGSIPGLGTICDAAGSIFGQLITGAIDLVTGPGSFAVSTLFSATGLDSRLMEGVVRWLAGEQVDINVKGANYGNYINYGAKLAANDACLTKGCKELSPRQSMEWREYRDTSLKEEYQQKSFATRLFDVTDNRSLAGNFIAKNGSNPTIKFATSIPTLLPSLFSSSLGALTTPFTKSANAAPANYSYGFPDFGFSLEELRDRAYDNPFENAAEVRTILNSANGDAYVERAEKCFGVILSKTDGSLRSADKPVNYVDYNETEGCSASDEEWTRIRFYILDTSLMEAYACIENDEAACSSFGLPNEATTES